MQYVYALNPVCIVSIIPGHSAEVPVRAVDIVSREYNDIHRTWHTLININNMKFFNSLFRVCLIFYTYDSLRTSKSIRINTMKKYLLAAGPAYYRMCSTDVYCSKQTGSSSTKGNHHPSFLRFWNWAEENCRCSQNLWRREMLLKRNSKHS